MIHPDSTAPSKPNVLAQLSAGKNRAHFALALFVIADIAAMADLSVNLKMVSGKFDQIAGVVWRYQDPNNYYALYVNAMGRQDHGTQDSRGESNRNRSGLGLNTGFRRLPKDRSAGVESGPRSSSARITQWSCSTIGNFSKWMIPLFKSRENLESGPRATRSPTSTNFRIDRKKE